MKRMRYVFETASGSGNDDVNVVLPLFFVEAEENCKIVISENSLRSFAANNILSGSNLIKMLSKIVRFTPRQLIRNN